MPFPPASRTHALTLLAGGNNAVTRPAVLALGMPLSKVGLITLDAHFDMRELDEGLSNGNPVRALMEDGLPGSEHRPDRTRELRQQPSKMHRDALAAGNLVDHASKRSGATESRHAIELAIEHVEHCDAIVVDCDIDVIDRSQMPGRARALGRAGCGSAISSRRCGGSRPISGCV